MKHGAYAVIAAERVDAKVREVFDALAADAPLRASDGGLPAADGAMVRLAAEVMCRLDDVTGYLGAKGWMDEKGNPRTIVLELEGRLRREAADHLDALGCSPRSRAKLGLDVARSQAFDLAQHWAETDVSGDQDGDVIDGDAA
ncbi:hypothetical protein NBH00_14855 [Paraconexibacter antarcticus]|uniref:Uncharacterized protein n=1 Tax=Paraconexibacter antarcticus TaxID=2949664 RepID=A0ABY5DPC0_9ACTN|nr:hypothetical protein [Paraconexibacter antarcticus]UTI62637.1 hypothetical protein NBH00_14855 [Paraconexibacter antarcticus]